MTRRTDPRAAPGVEVGGLRRIERAMAFYLEFRDTGEDREVFLARHADLRDLLECMLADAPVHADVATHRELGGFRLVREIGRGGMGVVYEARELALDRRVALKVLPPHLTQRPSSVARFRREATTIAGLAHPNIVRVLAVGQDGDTHWFAMEFVDGQALDRLLGERANADSMPANWTRQAAGIAAQVADALEHAHRAGVVHRDVKPANVLLRPDGTAVLTDFGLARDDDVPSVTAPGGRAGTPFYMSPEQVIGDPAGVDHRTDVFSLGVTLYEMLTGRRPFDGATSQAVLGEILAAEPPDPRRFNAALPRDLAAVVLRALEKEPQRRYGTAGDVADDLRAWLEHRPVQARPASSVARVRRWVRREPFRALLAAVLVIGVPSLAGLSGYLLKRAPEIRAGQEKMLEDLLEQGLMLMGSNHREHLHARAAFEQVLALVPDHEEGLVGMATVIDRWEGGPSAAIAFLDAHATDLARSRCLQRLRVFMQLASGERAAADAAEARLGKPESAFEYMLAGQCQVVRAWSGDPAAMQRGVEYVSLAARLTPRPRMSFYLALGNVLVAADERRGRRETARVLETLWPDSSRAWSGIGEVLRAIDPEAAVAACRRGLQIFPDEVGLLSNLADALLYAGHVDDALAEADRIVALQPAFDGGHISRSDCLVAVGRLDEALVELAIAESLVPQSYLVHARRGAILMRLGRPAEARTELETSLRLTAWNAPAARDLAALLLDAGEVEPARDWLARAVGFAPHDVGAHELLLRCCERLDDAAGLTRERERWLRCQVGD